jgi:hypothetical protein
MLHQPSERRYVPEVKPSVGWSDVKKVMNLEHVRCESRALELSIPDNKQ